MKEASDEQARSEIGPEPTVADGPETMRKAIRAVSLAQLLVARSMASRARREAERVAWHADRIAGKSAAADEPPQQLPADPALVALREAVRQYVRSRRDAGEAPERVLASLKATIHAIPGTELPSNDASLVFDVIVPLAIKEYFARR